MKPADPVTRKRIEAWSHRSRWRRHVAWEFYNDLPSITTIWAPAQPKAPTIPVRPLEVLPPKYRPPTGDRSGGWGEAGGPLPSRPVIAQQRGSQCATGQVTSRQLILCRLFDLVCDPDSMRPPVRCL